MLPGFRYSVKLEIFVMQWCRKQKNFQTKSAPQRRKSTKTYSLMKSYCLFRCFPLEMHWFPLSLPLADSKQHCTILLSPHTALSTFKPFSLFFSFTKPSCVFKSKINWPDNRHNICSCLKLFHSSIISLFQKLTSSRQCDHSLEV